MFINPVDDAVNSKGGFSCQAVIPVQPGSGGFIQVFQPKIVEAKPSNSRLKEKTTEVAMEIADGEKEDEGK